VPSAYLAVNPLAGFVSNQSAVMSRPDTSRSMYDLSACRSSEREVGCDPVSQEAPIIIELPYSDPKRSFVRPGFASTRRSAGSGVARIRTSYLLFDILACSGFSAPNIWPNALVILLWRCR